MLVSSNFFLQNEIYTVRTLYSYEGVGGVFSQMKAPGPSSVVGNTVFARKKFAGFAPAETAAPPPPPLRASLSVLSSASPMLDAEVGSNMPPLSSPGRR